MDCYKLVGGTLQSVPDPIKDHGSDSYEASIRAAGYTILVCSSAVENAAGAEISIYETAEPNQPRFYIDVMGANQSIASLLAEDFPSLLATLKELQPLTALIGLDQRAWIHADALNEREEKLGH